MTAEQASPEVPGPSVIRERVQISAPAMPLIGHGEEPPRGMPVPLVDGVPRTIGWQRQSDGLAFVIIGRGLMGGYKILERFQPTEDGWARAWQSLVETDAASAGKIVEVLTEREAAAARLQQQQPREPERDTQPVLIVTTNEVPGYRVVEVHGDVFGLIVRARNYFSNLGASFRTLAGGEVGGYTKLLTDSRNQARERMWREARARGANAVVAMRFDCNEIGDIMSEIAAYGTAVTVERTQATSAPTGLTQDTRTPDQHLG